MNLVLFFQIALTLVSLITSTLPGRTKRVAGHVSLAKPGQFPHAVFLYWYWNVKPLRQLTRFKCTSNLLSANYLVTAAHCYYHLLYTFRNYSSASDFVYELTKKQGHTYTRAGSVDGFGLDRGWQDRQANRVYIPGAYARPSTMFDMDVALVFVPIPFVLGIPHISHVAIARVSEVPHIDDYRDCIAAGFGYINANQMQLVVRPDYRYGTPAVMKNKLHFFKVKFALNNFCKYLQQQLDGSLIYFDEFYGCARSIGTIKNSTYATGCFGDAGGPLVCSGLLTGILVQRREREPCDFYSSDTAFTMYTLLGASDIQEWLRKRLIMEPLVPLPPWDPWAVTEPSVEELRVSVGTGIGARNVSDKKEELVNQRQESERKEDTRRFEIQSDNEGRGEKLKDVREKRDHKEVRVINGTIRKVTESTDKINRDSVGIGGEIRSKNNEIPVMKMEGRHLDSGGSNLMRSKAADGDFLMQGGEEMHSISDSTASLPSFQATRPANTNTTQRQWGRSQGKDRDCDRGSGGRTPLGVANGKTTEQQRIRRNVNGEVVQGDVRDDDPDLLRLVSLIRGGGVEVDPVRRKRQEARWQPREAMAKDLLRATRDLDPVALHRFGMGADVLTRDDVGDDKWAREVWEEVFEDDRAK